MRECSKKKKDIFFLRTEFDEKEYSYQRQLTIGFFNNLIFL
jgi:hypothetical protein